MVAKEGTRINIRAVAALVPGGVVKDSEMPGARVIQYPDETPRLQRCSGYSPSSPSREASHMPRSVISPVTSRAGVTSKA